MYNQDNGKKLPTPADVFGNGTTQKKLPSPEEVLGDVKKKDELPSTANASADGSVGSNSNLPSLSEPHPSSPDFFASKGFAVPSEDPVGDQAQYLQQKKLELEHNDALSPYLRFRQQKDIDREIRSLKFTFQNSKQAAAYLEDRLQKSGKPLEEKQDDVQKPFNLLNPAPTPQTKAGGISGDNVQPGMGDSIGGNEVSAEVSGGVGVGKPFTMDGPIDKYSEESIRNAVNPRNQTEKVALETYFRGRHVTEALKGSTTIDEAAAKFYGLQNKQTAEQLKALGANTLHDLPGAYAGNLVANFISMPEVQEKAQQDPDFATELKNKTYNLLTDYPDYAKRVVSQIISQERENRGDNNGIVNIVGKGSTDELVEQLVSEGKMDLRMKKVYEEQIRPSLGILRSIGRGIGRAIPGVQAMVNEAPIKTPGILENIEDSYVNTMHGMANTVEDVTNKIAAANGIHAVNDRDQLYEAVQKDYSALNLVPKNMWHEVLQNTGHITGFVLPMLLGGEAAESLNIGKGAGEAMTNFMMFEGTNSEQALKELPNDPGKQALYTLIATGADMALGKLIPTGEALKGIKNSFRTEVINTIDDFTSDRITAEAAKDRLSNHLVNGLAGVVKSNAKIAGTMTAFNVFHNGLDAAFGGRDVSFDDVAGDAVQTFKSAFLGSSLISMAAVKGDNPKLSGDVLTELANHRSFYKKVIEDGATLDPKLAATKNDRLTNLNEATLIVRELDGVDHLTQAQKDKYAIQALNQKVFERKALDAHDDVMKEDYLKKAEESKQRKLSIWNGEDKALEHQAYTPTPDQEVTPEEKAKVGDAVTLVKELAETGQLPDVYKQQAIDNPHEFLKFVHEQSETQPLETEDQFSKPLVDAAKEVRPIIDRMSAPAPEAQPEIKQTPLESQKADIENRRQQELGGIAHIPERLMTETVTPSDPVHIKDVKVSDIQVPDVVRQKVGERLKNGKTSTRGDNPISVKYNEDGTLELMDGAHRLLSKPPDGKIDVLAFNVEQDGEQFKPTRNVRDEINARHDQELSALNETPAEKPRFRFFIDSEGRPHIRAQVPGYDTGEVNIHPLNGETPPPADSTPPGEPPSEPPAPPLKPGDIPDEGSITAIQNSIVDRKRLNRGFAPAMETAHKEFGDTWDEANKKIEDGYKAQDLIDDLKKKSRPLTDVENAILLREQIIAEQEYHEINDKINKAGDRGDRAAFDELWPRLAVASDKLLDIYEVGRRAGTENARGLVTRKMLAREDFSLASMTTQQRAALGGRKLSTDEMSYVQKLHDKINEAQKKFDDYVKEVEERESKRAADTALENITREVKTEKQATPPAEPTEPKVESKGVAGIKKAFDKKIDEAAQKLIDKLTPPGMKDVKKSGVGMSELITAAAEVIKKAHHAGTDIRAAVESAIEFIKTKWDHAWGSFPEKDLRDHFGEIKIDKPAADDLKNVREIAKEHIRDGVTGLDEVVRAVKTDIEPYFPGITDREVRDAISGYGKEVKTREKDEVQKHLEELQKQATLVSKIEDAKNDKPLPAGKDKAKPSDEVKRLREELEGIVQEKGLDDPKRLAALKKRIQTQINEYSRRLKTGDLAPKPKRDGPVMDAEAMDLQAQLKRHQDAFKGALEKERLKNRTAVQKGLDTFVKVERAFKLSSVKIFAKLGAAAMYRMISSPVEEAIGATIYNTILPRKILDKAYRESGLNTRAEAKAITDGFMKGLMLDFPQVLKTGKSNLDVLFGKYQLPPEALELFGKLHSAMKTIPKRAEFERSFEKRAVAYMRQGIDVSNALVQFQIGVEAYKDANRAIFMNDNIISDSYTSMIRRLENDMKNPNRSASVAAALKFFLPFVKVPTNIVAEATTYATGTVQGAGFLAKAFVKGLDKVTPDEADRIMRCLKKGSLGLGLMLWGYYNHKHASGYYQQGEKRKADDVKAGELNLFGARIPKWLLHNPLLETIQLGATMHRVAHTYIKKDGVEKGIGEGALAATLGLVEEVPFVNQSVRMSKIFSKESEQNYFFGELAKGTIDPQMLVEIADWLDTKDRNPKTILQHIETGIPILREQVPAKHK